MESGSCASFIPRWRLRLYSRLAFYYRADSFVQRSGNDPTSVRETIEQRRCQLKLRKALDILCQDLLNLSHYLSTTRAERQLLLDRKANIGQQTVRNTNRDRKASLLLEIDAVERLIEILDKKMTRATQNKIPSIGFYIRLKRLHKRLPLTKPRPYDSTECGSFENRISYATIKSLLSFPVPKVLDELAVHLLTTSFPISEPSFLLIIHRFCSLRLASAARSAYYSLVAAGYVPNSPKVLSLLLKITPSISDRKEFSRLQTLLYRLSVPLDAHIYTALVVGNLKLGARTRAIRHFRAMIADGIQPGLHVLTGLLQDCGSRRDWALGIEVWRALKIGQTNLQFQIDARAYSTMWRLCRRCHQYFSAREIIALASKDGLQPIEVIRQGLKKHKTYPIRSTNKYPAINDIRNSLQRTIIINGSSWGPISQAHPAGRETSFEVIYGRDSRSLFARDALISAQKEVDRILIYRSEKLKRYFPNIAKLNFDDIPEPLQTIRCSPTFCSISCLETEHVLDALEEELASALSTWFLCACEMERSFREIDTARHHTPEPLPVLAQDILYCSRRRMPLQRRVSRIQTLPRKFIPKKSIKVYANMQKESENAVVE